jgi:hypothetical protein
MATYGPASTPPRSRGPNHHCNRAIFGHHTHQPGRAVPGLHSGLRGVRETCPGVNVAARGATRGAAGRGCWIARLPVGICGLSPVCVLSPEFSAVPRIPHPDRVPWLLRCVAGPSRSILGQRERLLRRGQTRKPQLATKRIPFSIRNKLAHLRQAQIHLANLLEMPLSASANPMRLAPVLSKLKIMFALQCNLAVFHRGASKFRV